MTNNSIYQRYVTDSIVVPQLFCLVILTSIIWLVQILRMVFLFEKQINFLEFLKVIIFLLPALAHMILPFATLYASLYVYNNMKVNKELVVLENAGFYPKDLIKPLIRLGLITSVIGVINGAYILPKTYGMMKDKISYYRSNFTTSIIQEGMFNNISKNVVIFLHKKITPVDFEGIILFDSRNPKMQTVMFADKGSVYIGNNNIIFDLFNGQRQTLNDSGVLDMMAFDKFKIQINSSKTNNRRFEDRDLQEHYLWELLFPKKNSKKSFTKLFAEGNNRLIWPFFNLLLPAVAISIFIKGEFNRKEYTRQLVQAFAIAMGIISLHFVAVSYAAKDVMLNFLIYLNVFFGFLIYHKKIRV